MPKYRVIKKCHLGGKPVNVGETFERPMQDATVKALLRFKQIELVEEKKTTTGLVVVSPKDGKQYKLSELKGMKADQLTALGLTVEGEPLKDGEDPLKPGQQAQQSQVPPATGTPATPASTPRRQGGQPAGQRRQPQPPKDTKTTEGDGKTGTEKPEGGDGTEKIVVPESTTTILGGPAGGGKTSETADPAKSPETTSTEGAPKTEGGETTSTVKPLPLP